MIRLRIVTFVGTRPEIIRLSRLIQLLDRVSDHTLVHTGQNNDPNLSDIFFSDLGLREPDFYLGISNSSPGRAMANTLEGAEKILLEHRPDAVIVLGDTNSAIAALISRRMGIPVYHLEAGNRSFDDNVPEEINRKVIDHSASFNLPYSEPARRNLISEGLHPRYICLTGSPIPEVIEYHSKQIAESEILQTLALREKKYFVISAHRQENVDSPSRLGELFDSLNALCDKYGEELIFSMHPRTRAKVSDLNAPIHPLIRFIDPIGYFDYLRLQLGAMCVLSDSGTVSEEASILGFRAVTIRDSMERPEALESGGISMSGLQKDNVLRAVEFQLELLTYSQAPQEYRVTNFAQRVYLFIESTAPRYSQWRGLRN
jgi:UDP-N-acetylglucosamine 2-epimerase (non-hydrolysing)